MQPTYHIILRIKAGGEWESFGRFDLGSKRACAEKIFSELHGSTDVHNRLPIQVDFMEMGNGIPLSLHIIACTLDELCRNVRIITREVFKLYNLSEL
ncbi:MAG TPA: hypothetical protein VG738_22565 [Chitinophagaceae bacterium]|nr:hypothetical protein [Chitinophagaceae bacterium]